MDCGIPFCHTGCPLGTASRLERPRPPEPWQEALSALHDTNNFPEFTGKTCPAPCEASCVLALNGVPVTIKTIEQAIVDRGWRWGGSRRSRRGRDRASRSGWWAAARPGLAAAQQLRRAGHAVTVYERDDRLGGLLVYGIPDFKMAKEYVTRRIDQMRAEGVEFVPNATSGRTSIRRGCDAKHDALVLTVGRDPGPRAGHPGRAPEGVIQAMDFLTAQNRRGFGDQLGPDSVVATGKNVIIIGGGDTAADCLGTCHRQGGAVGPPARLQPMPAGERQPGHPWPLWPKILRVTPAHEEGGKRDWQIKTQHFAGDEAGGSPSCTRCGCSTTSTRTGAAVRGAARLRAGVPVRPGAPGDRVRGPERGLPEKLGLAMTEGGAIRSDAKYQTSVPGVFTAGDCRRGQSLVVWAIAEGREAARHVDEFLTGRPSRLRGRDLPLGLVR
jgi:glutamate synthase (NADPH/NADH) small chain